MDGHAAKGPFALPDGSAELPKSSPQWQPNGPPKKTGCGRHH